MTHNTLILVIRRLSKRARQASLQGPSKVHAAIAAKCRAKIDQLTKRYS